MKIAYYTIVFAPDNKVKLECVGNMQSVYCQAIAYAASKKMQLKVDQIIDEDGNTFDNFQVEYDSMRTYIAYP